MTLLYIVYICKVGICCMLQPHIYPPTVTLLQAYSTYMYSVNTYFQILASDEVLNICDSLMLKHYYQCVCVTYDLHAPAHITLRTQHMMPFESVKLNFKRTFTEYTYTHMSVFVLSLEYDVILQTEPITFM